MDEQEDYNIFEELLKSRKPRSAKKKHSKSEKPSPTLSENISESQTTCDRSFQSSVQPHAVVEETGSFNKSGITSYLNSKDWRVLSECQDSQFHYVLIDKNNFVTILVYKLPGNEDDTAASTDLPEPYHDYDTALCSSLFQDDSHLFQGCRLLYVMHQKISPDSVHQASTKKMAANNIGVLNLHSPLFIYLFGPEPACTLSPVLLLCANYGHVFTYSIVSRHSGNLQPFCSGNGPIVSVMPITLTSEDSGGDEAKRKTKILESLRMSLESTFTDIPWTKEQSLDGLLVIGKSGELCLFIQPPDQSVTVPFLLSLHEPVTTCLAIGKHVVYSTGTSLKACQLRFCKREKQFSIYVTSDVILGHAKIIDLRIQDYGKNSNECHLVGLTGSYDLVSIAALGKSSLSQETPTGFHFSEDLFLEANHDDNPSCLGDTLNRLNVHAQAIESLHKRSHQLDSALLQLNLFANIVQDQKLSQPKTCNQHGGQVESFNIVECACELFNAADEGSASWRLRVRLVNKSSVAFSDKIWSLSISENPILSHSSRHLNDFNLPKPTSHQFWLEKGLKAKSDIILTVPVVESALFGHLLELHISVSLVLYMESLCVEQRTRSNDVKHKLMQVEIYNKSFDIVNFLQRSSLLDGENGGHMTSNVHQTSYREDWLDVQLQRMAVGRTGGCNKILMDSEATTQSFSLSVGMPDYHNNENSIHRNTEILRSIFGSEITKKNESSCSLISPGLDILSVSVEECAARDFKNKNDEDAGQAYLRIKGHNMMMLYSVFEAMMKRKQAKPWKHKQEDDSSHKKLKNLLQQLKIVHSRLKENLNVIKFGSVPNQSYMMAFCQFLDNMKDICFINVSNPGNSTIL